MRHLLQRINHLQLILPSLPLVTTKSTISDGSRNFFHGVMVLKKYKLYNQIKREIVPKKNNKKRNSYIDNNNNKKTRKYIKFTITFYGFSYFEIGA